MTIKRLFSSHLRIASTCRHVALSLRLAATVLLMGVALSAVVHAQAGAGDWTWMGGSSSVGSNGGGQSGVYGTLGTPAAGNIPGGPAEASSWTDHSGNFWLFGGVGIGADGNPGYLNSLWEFNPSTNQWAWMGGSSTSGSFSGQPGVYGTLGTPAAGNIPGSTDSASTWVDNSGNLWLFGGLVYGPGGNSGSLNELWEFNPSTNEWAWMSGSSTVINVGGPSGVYGVLGTPASGNVPGGRSGASSWTDSSGHLWLFGGHGADAQGNFGSLNDLWEFNPSTNEWTWMSGSSTVVEGSGSSGVYGTLGTPAAGNVPGGRTYASSWTDSSGHLWLFGGQAIDANGKSGPLNDLWEFNPSTNEWAWMSGSSTVSCGANQSQPYCGPPGVYGTLGTPAAGNIPGGRAAASNWTDSSGHFWLFGGQALDTNGTDGLINDLWEFNPSTSEWTWMGGGSTAGQPGVYGTLGTNAVGNTPGARDEVSSWTDSSGNLWLFGGYGFDANGNYGYLNDLWRYQLSATTLAAAATPTFSVPGGTYSSTQSVTISDTTPNATIYYTTDGTTPTANSTVYSGTAITVASTATIEAIATASGYTQSAVATAAYTINLPAVAAPTFSVAAGTYSTGQTVTISDTTPGATIYYTTNGTAPTTSSAVYSGAITVSSTETLQAIATASGYTTSAAATALYTITPSTASSTGDWTWVGGSNVDPAGTAGQSGVYGTLGTAAAGNVPGGRSDAMSWTDSSGNRWLFGGIGLDANGKVGELNDLWELNPSTNIWTWVSGSNSVGSFLGTNGEYAGQPGVYGTLGVAAAGNTPGSREGASTWVDSKGNLWLFGGFGWDQTVQFELIEFNDLWEFNPSTNQWTWMGGSNTAETDTGQNGVYGTMGTPAARNIPGSRYNAASWKDSSGNFWLFGGYGLLSNGDLGDMNDLWEFSPSTDQWTWMGGSPTVSSCMRYSSEDIFCDQTGSYGTLGTAAQGNIPPGRSNASTWTDSAGNLWLFGGNSNDPSQVFAGIIYNDLWKFNPASGEWTWVGGSSVPPNCVTNSADECAKLSVYGTLGTPAAGDTPGSRSSAVTWTDSSGNLWLFGGSGYDSAGTLGELSDLWEFNPSTNQWTWIGGSNIANQNGVYGTLATPATGNVPGGRTEAVSWTDLNGGFWLFGGLGFPSAGGQSYLNDLWAYRATTTTLPTAATPAFSVAGGSYSSTQSVTISDTTPGATIYYTTNGTTPTTSSTVYNGTAISVSGTEIIEAIATASNYTTSAVATAAYEVQVIATTTTPTVTVTPASLSITTAQSLSVAISLGGGQCAAVRRKPTGATVRPEACSTITPTGTVTLSGGGYTSAAATLSGGSATIIIPAGSLTTGTDTLTATYTPDSNSSSIYTSATGTNPVTVTAAVTAVTPTVTVTPASSGITTDQSLSVAISVSSSSPCEDVRRRAAISAITPEIGCTSATSTGTVTLTGGGYTSAAATLSGGAATITIPAGSLATGTDTLTATYTPDSNSASTYASGTGTNTVTVTAALNFTVASSTGTQTVQPGGAATYTINVNPVNGAYSSVVTLTASGLPTGATASFVPATVTPGSAAATSTLTVQTAAPITTAANSRWPLATPLLALIGLFFVPGKRRRRWITLGVLLIASLSALTALSGCGGGFAITKSSQTYTITVTGTSGADVQTTTVQLTVQ